MQPGLVSCERVQTPMVEEGGEGAEGGAWGGIGWGGEGRKGRAVIKVLGGWRGTWGKNKPLYCKLWSSCVPRHIKRLTMFCLYCAGQMMVEYKWHWVHIWWLSLSPLGLDLTKGTQWHWSISALSPTVMEYRLSVVAPSRWSFSSSLGKSAQTPQSAAVLVLDSVLTRCFSRLYFINKFVFFF